MTLESWLQSAAADAERRGLPELRSALEALAHSTALLRAADFNNHANGEQSSVDSHRSSVAGRQASVDGRRS
jgi:hypothetical protein